MRCLRCQRDLRRTPSGRYVDSDDIDLCIWVYGDTPRPHVPQR